MGLMLVKFQESNDEAQKLKTTEELQEGLTDINRVLHYQRLLFILKII